MGDGEKKPEFVRPLNPKEHGQLIFSGCDTCTLCCDGSTFTCANVLLDEMFDTAKLFPVVFTKSEERLSLSLLYTLQKGVPCPYLDAETTLCEVYDSVRPRACKIFPFNVREVRAASPDQRSFSVVFDERCPGIRPDEEAPPEKRILGPDGRLSPEIADGFIGQHMLRRYRENLQNTQKFLKLVHELELLGEEEVDIGGPPATGTFYGQSRPSTIRLWKISETRLGELDGEAVMRIHREGFFNAIYTHLNSLGNLDKLIRMREKFAEKKVDFLSFRV
jgi:Fe-S-cluster containining protein